jgi:hypothetical protein
LFLITHGKMQKKKRQKNAKKGKRPGLIPVIPAMPDGSSPGVLAKILPAWQYGDPAVVVERLEGSEIMAEVKRQQRDAERAELLAYVPPAPSFDKVGADTRRLIKRQRIRELVAAVLGKKVPA